MSNLDPRFENDYARLRALQEMRYWALEAKQGRPEAAKGLLLTASRCQVLMDRLDPDQSKRREMKEAAKVRGSA